jgi:hypothetical protein
VCRANAELSTELHVAAAEAEAHKLVLAERNREVAALRAQLTAALSGGGGGGGARPTLAAVTALWG